jgi:hypothetical protein
MSMSVSRSLLHPPSGRRHSSGIGAQDAGSQADGERLRPGADQGALLVAEATFGADQHGDGRGRGQGTQRHGRIGDGFHFVAENDFPGAVQRLAEPCEPDLRQQLRHRQHAALFGGLDDVGAQPVRVLDLDLCSLRLDRDQASRAHLDGLLHHVVEPRLFERGEGQGKP